MIRNQKNVVYITFFSKKFSNEILSWDFSAITFFIKNNLGFRLALNMNEIKNSFIVWSPSVHMVSPKIKKIILKSLHQKLSM